MTPGRSLTDTERELLGELRRRLATTLQLIDAALQDGTAHRARVALNRYLVVYPAAVALRDLVRDP